MYYFLQHCVLSYMVDPALLQLLKRNVSPLLLSSLSNRIRNLTTQHAVRRTILLYRCRLLISVHFTVTMAMEDLDALEKGDGLYKYFKLESSVATTNMVLFDQYGQLEK